jgi:hypothetical protein
MQDAETHIILSMPGQLDVGEDYMHTAPKIHCMNRSKSCINQLLQPMQRTIRVEGHVISVINPPSKVKYIPLTSPTPPLYQGSSTSTLQLPQLPIPPLRRQLSRIRRIPLLLPTITTHPIPRMLLTLPRLLTRLTTILIPHPTSHPTSHSRRPRRDIPTPRITPRTSSTNIISMSIPLLRPTIPTISSRRGRAGGMMRRHVTVHPRRRAMRRGNRRRRRDARARVETVVPAALVGIDLGHVGVGGGWVWGWDGGVGWGAAWRGGVARRAGRATGWGLLAGGSSCGGGGFSGFLFLLVILAHQGPDAEDDEGDGTDAAYHAAYDGADGG